MDLDFSDLSDDQLLGLVRGALREITARGPAMAAAANDAMLDEAERARVAAEAAANEAAVLRARERERVAEQARARVRAAQAAQEAEANRLRSEKAASRAEAAAREAAWRMRQAEEQQKDILREASALVGRPAAEITLVLAPTRFGRRLLINKGGDQEYARDHLVDWRVGSQDISTTRDLVRRRPELVALGTRLAEIHGRGELRLRGADYHWE